MRSTLILRRKVREEGPEKRGMIREGNHQPVPGISESGDRRGVAGIPEDYGRQELHAGPDSGVREGGGPNVGSSVKVSP